MLLPRNISACQPSRGVGYLLGASWRRNCCGTAGRHGRIVVVAILRLIEMRYRQNEIFDDTGICAPFGPSHPNASRVLVACGRSQLCGPCAGPSFVRPPSS